jgi:hypothetical protein
MTHPESQKLTAMQLCGRIIPRTNLTRYANFRSYMIEGRFEALNHSIAMTIRIETVGILR